MNSPSSKKQTPYDKKLWWRKARMYLAWALTFVVCLCVSANDFHQRFFRAIDPQIKSAYVKMTELLPGVALTEAAMDTTYELLLSSRKDAVNMGFSTSGDYDVESAPLSEDLRDSITVEWVTRLNVGNGGAVYIVRKDDGTIVAHPNKSQVGKKLMVSPLNNIALRGTNVVNYSGLPETELLEFDNEQATDTIELKHLLLFPGDGNYTSTLKSMNDMLFGSIVSYDEYYVVCGITIWEYLGYMARSVYVSIIACALMWLFVHFICLTLDKHNESASGLRTRLAAYGLILTLALFVVSWYVQVLCDTTDGLNAMQSYSDAGVASLKAYSSARDRINSWLDDQYLDQCRVARDYVKSKGTQNVTREDLADMSKRLGIWHIYVYDEQGQVIVTNSPYDHLTLSDDPEKPSYAFRSLLEGADHVIQAPVPDEVTGTRTQFVGVSLRNDQDKADGFVQVAVDPELRDILSTPLGMDSVLNNIIVGKPTIAMTFDKANMTVTASTQPSLVGLPIESFNYTAEKLKTNKSGFIDYGGEEYYAGFAEADDCYLVPASPISDYSDALTYSLRNAFIVACGLALILALALYNYQSDVVDAAPQADPNAAEKRPARTSFVRRAMQAAATSGVMRSQDKEGFEERWHMDDPTSEKTPGQRTMGIAYRMLFVFCLLHLIPVAYSTFFQGKGNVQLSGLTYVLNGDWEKGANIFALTSCLVLLFILYVVVSVTNRILYSIAKVSDLRTETVCLLLKSCLSYVCVIAFIYYGLSQFGIPTQALLASAGIITLAVSVGAKDLVNDFIAGFFILLEGTVKVGDHITVGSWTGIVREIGLRTTKIDHPDETKIFNNSSLKDIVTKKQQDKVEVEPEPPVEAEEPEETVETVTLTLPVPLSADLAKIETVLAKELPGLLDGVEGLASPPAYEGVERLEGTTMYLQFALEAKGGEQQAALRQLMRLLKLLFDRYGIAL